MWIPVTQRVLGSKAIKNVINSDFVERIAESTSGCYLEMNSGFTVEIEESINYWLEAIKEKNGE